MANDLKILYKYCLIAALEYNKLSKFKPSKSKNDDLFEHIRKLFSKSQEYHDKNLEEIQSQPKKNFLNVGIIEAKELIIKSSNSPIDPYCYIYLIKNNDVSTNNNNIKKSNHRKTNSCDFNEKNKIKLKESPPNSPNSSINSSPKLLRKASNRGSSFRGLSMSNEIINSNKTSHKEKTLTPLWNERFQYEIEDRNNQTLIIQCYSYDAESASLLSNLTKNSNERRFFKPFKSFLENRKISDDFIGQIQIPLKDIIQNETKWYDLYCKHYHKSHGVKGKIKLNLEFFFKLSEKTGLNTPDLIPNMSLNNQNVEVNTEKFTIEYHKLVQIIMDNELSKRKKDVEEWDGSIDYFSQTLLRLFRETFFISDLSKQIIDLITKMELKKMYTELLSDQKIISDLIKLSNDITDNPSIILFCCDYEKKKLYNDSCAYIREYFSNKSFTVFPPSNDNEKIISECIKISNQMDKFLCAIFGDEIINFKKVPGEIIAKRLQDDVYNFITNKINLDEAVEKNDQQLLKWMNNINSTMEEILSFNERLLYFNNNLYNRLDIDCCKIVAIAISNCLTGPVKYVLKCLSDYQFEYRTFTANMKLSSHVSTHLYLNCRELCNHFAKYINGREKFKFQLNQYPYWFKESQIVSFWLETFKIVSKEFVTNALKMEDVKEISVGENPGITMTSVLVAEHLKVICNEWNEINFPDTETKYIGTAILTEVINDTCRFFVETLKNRLEELNYFFENRLSVSQSLTVTITKICILMNNIDYLKVSAIASLSTTLKFDSLQKEIEETYNELALSQNIRDTLEKSINEAMKDMDILTNGILENLRTILKIAFKGPVLSLYCNKNSNILEMIHKNLHLVNTKMPAYSKQLVIIMWNNLVKIMHQCLPQKEPASFYEFVNKILKSLEELFISYDLPFEYTIRTNKNVELLKLFDNELKNYDYCCNDNRNSDISDISIDLNEVSDLDCLTAKLELFSKSTEDIILDYLTYLNKYKSSNSGDIDNYGSILFKIGYEEDTNTTVKVNIKIMYCKNLQALDVISKSSDPYVEIEILPKNLFNDYEIKKTCIVYKNLNPIFNETFTFKNIPKELMKKQGACVRFNILDYDLIGGDDFCGEAFFPLMFIDSMEKYASIDMMPVIISNLKQPDLTEKNHFKELERRTEFDNNASEFLNYRSWLIEKCALQKRAKISAIDENCLSIVKTSINKIRSKFPCLSLQILRNN